MARNVDLGPLRGNTIQERIAHGMQRAGLNIQDVSRRLSVRWQTVQSWLPGPSDRTPTVPRGKNLQRLAEVLSVSVDEILGVATGQEPPFEAWKAFRATPQGQAATAAELRTLQAIVWPPGTQPTLASYLTAFAALQTLEPREEAGPVAPSDV